jgi:hypothetical protein
MSALFWVALGCGGGEEEAPVRLEAPPADRVDVQPYSGRWLPVRSQPDGTWARCDQGPTVEFRQDSEAGWEFVTTGADEIRVARVGRITPGEGVVKVELVGEDAVTLRWLDSGRVATFAERLGGQAFGSPTARQDLPVVSCGG